MRARLVVAAAVLAAGLRPHAAAAQGRAPGSFRIIVNAATPVASLSREQLSRMFLRKVARWDGGPPVAPVDLRDDGAGRAPSVRQAFSRAVLRRSPEMVMLYWQRQIFSGRQLPPPERASEAEVVSYVRSTPGAIGYVSDDADLRGVRVVDLTND